MFKKIIIIIILIIVAAATFLAVYLQPEKPPAHQVFINGTVLTMDANNAIVEAIEVRDERIVAVGTTEKISQSITDETQIIDLQGKTLMPGFIDAHGHFPGSGLNTVGVELHSPPVGNITTMEQLLRAVESQVAKTSKGDWVLGFYYDDTLLKEKRHPTRTELDQLSTDHPIVLVHVSGHMVVANSPALAVVNIDASTPDPVGGVIGRREGSQEPNGLLEETARMGLFDIIYNFGPLVSLNMVKAAAEEYAAVGVTTVQSGGVTKPMAEGLALLSRWHVFPQRLVLFPLQTDYSDSLLDNTFDKEAISGDKITVGPVKIVADGSVQGYTGYLSHPYHEPYKGDAEYRGYPSVVRDDLFEQVLALHKAGYQLAIHGNGDASIDDILDAFKAAQQAHPVEDPRLILIHAQMSRFDQLQRMKDLGVTPSFFSAHTWYWGDRHKAIFMGPERAAIMSPAKWAQDIDLTFSSHLDTPVVPMQPLQAVWSMVNRESVAGDVIGPEQRIDVMQALRAVTIDAAWQIFEEDNRGSIGSGKLADLVILSANPLDQTASMRDIKVEQTLVGGVIIYQRDHN